MPSGSGRVPCCLPLRPCVNFVHDPNAQCFLVAAWCHCQSLPVCPAACTPINPSAYNSCTDGLSPPTQSPFGLDIPNKKGCHSVPAERLLKNLFRLGNDHNECAACGDEKGNDPLLKRVHSDPIKVRTYCEILRGNNATDTVLHSHLVESYSLDGRHHPTQSKLRLRTSSSRLISHHSSSDEDWFEEVPPHSVKEKKENEKKESPPTPPHPPLLARSSFESDADSILVRDGILLPSRCPPIQRDHTSLNNLFLSDNCSAKSAEPLDSFNNPVLSLNSSISSFSGKSKIVTGRVRSASGSDNLSSSNDNNAFGESSAIVRAKIETRETNSCCGCAVS